MNVDVKQSVLQVLHIAAAERDLEIAEFILR